MQGLEPSFIFILYFVSAYMLVLHKVHIDEVEDLKPYVIIFCKVEEFLCLFISFKKAELISNFLIISFVPFAPLFIVYYQFKQWWKS
jgi:hypothetical protein